jgi:hypothetical protein
MSLKLHPECKKRLIEKTAKLLRSMNVTKGSILDLDSTLSLFQLESVLPKSGQIRELLKEYIGETPAFTFMSSRLLNSISDSLKYDAEAPTVPLKEIEQYKDTQAVAHRLVKDFESLPWAYSLTFEFPNDFGKLFSQTVKEYQLGDIARLVAPDVEFNEQFPLSKGGEPGAGLLKTRLLGLFSPKQWHTNSAVFQINVDGFVPDSETCAPIERAVSMFKSFLGLGIALRLYKIGRNADWYSLYFQPSFMIHRRISTDWQFEREYKLDASLSEVCKNLLLDDVGGMLDTDEKKAEWILDKLTLIKSTFDLKQPASKVMLASEWFLDSCAGAHRLFSFVQTAVVLEILLGDKARSDLLSLGELLGNRCAYLIAKSHKERENILEIFRKFYEVRSQIVHRGKPQLGLRENYLLHQMQQVCSRVISREVELLAQD